MKVINNLVERKILFAKKQVACLGYFDGLHKAHQKLLQLTLKLAKEKKYQSLFFTFSIAPKKMVLKHQYNDLLSLEDKIELISNQGFDNFVIFPFNETTKKWTINQFIDYLKKMNVEIIIVGDDFRFGFQRKGTINDLKANFSQVININLILENNERISTTYIRDLLKNKKIDLANKLLLQPYNIKGIVQKGNKLGRAINYPTANLHLSKIANFLPSGVYITKTFYKNKFYNSISCIFESDNILKCETYLFKFSGNLYNKEIKVFFLKYLRDNKKIISLEQLKLLINIDYKKAIEYFEKNR